MIEELAYLKGICRTCVYGFPGPVGYECSVMRKYERAIVTACEMYKANFEERAARRAERRGDDREA